MTITRDHWGFPNPTGATVGFANWGYGGTAQGNASSICAVWESTTVKGESYILDPGGANEAVGSLALRIIDTDLGLTAEIWFVSNYELYNGPNVGFLEARLTADATIPAVHEFLQHSWICTDDEMSVFDSDSIIEQASGDLGPNAVTGGLIADGRVQLMTLLSNETATTNLTPVAGEGWANGGSIEVLLNSKAVGHYASPATIDTENWGSTGMVVGGGSGMMVNFGEGGAGGGASRPKQSPMQFPMGLGNWVMTPGGILTR
ncbi:MAG: hypothetical protein ACYTFX_06255 [Planctomycetota bacterium]|jgi:hypothetical protein